MKRLRRYFSLSAAERGLLCRAAFLVGAIRIALWIMPFKSLRRMLAWKMAGERKAPARPRWSSERITWAVLAASRYVPNATCLAQALAAQLLLDREGYPTRLRIGARRDEEGFQAHAWVESEGKTVVGGLKTARYTELMALASERPQDP